MPLLIRTWRTYYYRAIFNWMPSREAYPLARKAVDRALAINPNLAIAHRALALTEKVLNNNEAAFRQEMQRAAELDPTLGMQPLDQGVLAYQAGRVSESVPLFQQAAELNPLDLWTLSWLANALYANQELAEAERLLRNVAGMNPEAAGAYCNLGRILLAEGKSEEALQVMSKEPEEASRLTCMPAALWSLGRHTEADAMLAEAKAKFHDAFAYGLAYCYAMRDDKDQAFTWLNRAYDRHDLHLQFMNEDPALRTLHSDPRFAVLAGKIAAAQ
jgi:tetratricopeptide (TPR) repeat protein